ncbi:ABC transporter permease [Melittangium boletus]|uniref:Uncharacterized protein n=1 Tax=Melittangium boletus DSM 14713 TaxID=1294270 RepID=A0A286NV49_9BACT|nr:ABC transporter permease [Melittangium boletus]ATB26948.1 hypothetical protein MEBOL_000383 [Melittangium boletus DSM 14713]
MIRPLLAKELRDQRPFRWLALFFLGCDVLATLWTEPLGFSPYAATFMSRFKADGDLSLMTFLLAFALGNGLLVREQDDRTLEFLDALPTSRWTLFWVKLLVALGTVLVYPLGMTGWTLFEQALAHPSLDPGWHLGALGGVSILRVAQALSILALSLALAPLRRLSWTVLALLMLGQSVLEDRWPWLSVLNPLRLAVPRFEGEQWLWPMKALGLQLALASGLLALALAQFLGVGERLAASAQRRLQGPWLGGLVTLTTVGLFIALLMRWDPGTEDGGAETPEVSFPEMAPARADTRHYRFTYPSSLSKRAGPLLDQADSVFETVRAFMGVEAGEPVRADLGGSQRHTAGTAFWNTLRMQLAHLSLPEEARAVLGHETTHVLAQRIVGPEGATRLGSLRMFNEGLASYVEYRFFQPPDAKKEDRVIAAAVRARREVKLEELLEPDTLAAQRDANLVYPLGRVFFEALVARHGEGAPARVLTALGRKDAPEDLEGALAWQDAFQSAGIDLSQVFDDFFARLDGLVAHHREWLDALPRPRGAVEREDGQVGLRAILDGEVPEGWSVVCRFRTDEAADALEYEGPFPIEEPHWRDTSALSAGVLWYQLGLMSPDGLTLYEPWTRIRVE